MPSEPDNKVEELVQTYAQKRRDDAGPSFELHPAIRQLLQGEVVRQRSKSSGRSRSWLGLLAGLAPRLGFALSILVVVGIVLWKVNLPSEATRRPAYKLAKADRIAPASPQAAVPANLPPPAPLAAPLSKQERSSVLSTADSRGLRTSAAVPSTAAVERAPKPLAKTNDLGDALGLASRAPQRFKRAGAAGKADPPAPGQPAVLALFDFYQTGNRIRIVDADGSVYEGPVIAGGGLELDKAKNRRPEPARSPNVRFQNEPSVLFRVTGTNRTVNQLVILNGSFQPSAGKAPMPEPGPAQRSDSAPAAAAPTPLALTGAAFDRAKALDRGVKVQLQDTSALRSFPSARIQGKARVGKAADVQIEAFPAAP